MSANDITDGLRAVWTVLIDKQVFQGLVVPVFDSSTSSVWAAVIAFVVPTI